MVLPPKTSQGPPPLAEALNGMGQAVTSLGRAGQGDTGMLWNIQMRRQAAAPLGRAGRHRDAPEGDGEQQSRGQGGAVTEIPNTVSLSDLDLQLPHRKGREKGGKIMFSLLAAQQRQHLFLPAPDSAKLGFHHLIVYTASPRRHTKINAHRSLSQEFINSFKGQGLIFHFL